LVRSPYFRLKSPNAIGIGTNIANKPQVKFGDKDRESIDGRFAIFQPPARLITPRSRDCVFQSLFRINIIAIITPINPTRLATTPKSALGWFTNALNTATAPMIIQNFHQATCRSQATHAPIPAVIAISASGTIRTEFSKVIRPDMIRISQGSRTSISNHPPNCSQIVTTAP
jgi:hypothetical protein